MPQVTDDSRTEIDPAQRLARCIAEQVGPKRFKAWFGAEENLQLTQDKTLLIAVPNRFAANWILDHYSQVIQSASEQILGYRPRLDFLIGQEGRSEQMPQPSRPKGQAKAAHQRPLLTLEDLVVGPSNELAVSAARAILRDGPSPFNPLFVHGGCGVGKTHLLQGICHQLTQVRPSSAWMYLSAEEFANQFVIALRNKSLDEFRKRIRQLDLLAIDDIHFLANKPSTQEEFFHTFNTISLAGRQVVMASDAPPRQIKQLSEKLVNRFVSGMVVRIDPPDLQMRYQICRRYIAKAAQRLGLANPTGCVPEEVITYVVQNVTANVRELEGAILKVLASASLQRTAITLELARQALQDHIQVATRPVDLRLIQQVVAEHLGIDQRRLTSPSRDRDLVIARTICIYLARKYTGLSLVQIGKELGNRHHATVIAALKRLEQMIANDKDIRWHGQSGQKTMKAASLLGQIEASLAH